MQNVSEQYCELSFVLSLGEYVIDGRMDRLCRNAEGWMVIDYKSGMGKGADLQLNVYRLAAEELLGQPVRMYLYSISSGDFLELEEISDEDMRTRIGKVWSS